MAGIVTPPTVVEPFGLNADPSLITLPIPVASQIGITAGAASYNDGFPPVTFQPEVSGGTPPLGQDFNGILYTVTAHIAAFSAGQPYLYNADIVAAIGGYPIGTVLGMADGSGAWISVTAGNVTDPDGGAPTGWLMLTSVGVANVTGITGGTTVLTPARYKKRIIVVSGALTNTAALIFPTQAGQEWLVINSCSGAFALTVKTAAGTGLIIPSGGPSSPVGVYCDGTNLQPTVSPLAVPISVAPTPNSLVERDNNGYAYAVYLNQNSAVEPATAIGAVFVQNTGADGFLRKVPNANFISGLSLSTVAATAAAITAALAAYSTTTAMNAAIAAAIAPLAPKANPVFSGNVNVGTRAGGDSTANAASTAFVQAAAAAVFGATGNNSATLPGGIIVKWGLVAQTSTANPGQVHAFPVAFPNACFRVVTCVSDSLGVEFFSVIGNPTAANFTQYSNNTCNVSYIAIGN